MSGLAPLVLIACSSDPDVFGNTEATSSSSGSGGGTACVPGQQSACACGGDTPGIQVCAADGSGYGPCDCGSGGGGPGGGGGEGGARLVCEPGETLPCYSGPDGTNGVGLCVPGIATCEPDGSEWGPCEGEVTPVAETCETAGDDDCDGQPNEDGVGCSCTPGEQQPCYSAPATTENVGPCHGGTQQCNAQGSGFGNCVGEITPILETCNTPADDDCDGQVNESGSGCVCAPNSSASCYEGPSGTQGVGTCHAGTHTCNDQGTGYGACIGQVLPLAFDLCSTVTDDDCDGSPMPCTVNPPWSKRFGNGSSIGLAVDGAGNIVVGAVGDSFDFGAGPLTGNFVLAKLDPQGNHVWSKGFSVGGGYGAYGLQIDASGNVLAVGTFVGPLNLGGQGLYSDGAGAFALKLDAAGNHVWSKGYPIGSNGNGPTSATAVATDSTGAVYFGGRLPAFITIDFGGGPIQANGDGFLVKLTAAGDHVWSKKLGSTNGGEVKSIAVDAIDNVFVSGWFNGTLAFGSVPSAGGSNDVFLAKLEPDGDTIWAKAFGDSGNQMDMFVALDANGNPSLAGRFEGQINLGGGPLTGNPVGGFAARLDAAGNHVWSHGFGTAPSMDFSAPAVAVDGNGRTLLTAGFLGTIDSGSGDLTSAGNFDVLFAGFDTIGTGVGATRYGDAQGQYGMKIAADNLDAPVIAGIFGGTLDFGPGGTITAAGNYDLFVAKLSP